jgi:hypothetical protein
VIGQTTSTLQKGSVRETRKSPAIDLIEKKCYGNLTEGHLSALMLLTLLLQCKGVWDDHSRV